MINSAISAFKNDNVQLIGQNDSPTMSLLSNANFV